MKTRHALRLALVATWLLIQPPVKLAANSSFDYDPQAPLSEWTVSGTFPSGDAGHDRCLASMNKQENEYSEATEHGTPGSMGYASAMAHAWAQCVPSDDPRLKFGVH
jgi:hypothetical protein